MAAFSEEVKEISKSRAQEEQWDPETIEQWKGEGFSRERVQSMLLLSGSFARLPICLGERDNGLRSQCPVYCCSLGVARFRIPSPPPDGILSRRR